MSYKSVIYDREKLYKEVWAEPMSQLSKKYGLSDVGLAKICKKLEIPRPEMGYWAKLQAGKRVEKPPKLPPMPGDGILTVERWVEDEDPLDEETEKRVCELFAAEKEPENQIRVARRLSSPHPLVEQAQAILSGKQRYRWDDERRYRRLAIDVSEACLPRALRIMDALLRALEKRRFSITIVKEQWRERRYETCVGILEESIPIRLREMYKQVEVTDSTSYRRIDLKRNGKLELQVSGWGYPTRCRRDGQKPLEEQLNSFVIGLIREAAVRRGRSLQRERERKEAEERRRLAEEEEKRRQAELGRIKQFERDADDWRKSQRLRAYIQAVEQRMSEGGGIDVKAWLEWAREHAEHLDPLNRLGAGVTEDDQADEDR
jgi:hypothetical protein